MVTAMTAGHVISTEKISTKGGRIPVISTGCHDDFCYMEALDIVEAKVAELCQEKASDFIILTNIICNNIIKK